MKSMLYTDLLRFLGNIYIVWAKDNNLCIAEKAYILEADTKTLNTKQQIGNVNHVHCADIKHRSVEIESQLHK